MDTMVTNVFGILCIFMYHSAGWFFPSEVILKSMYQGTTLDFFIYFADDYWHVANKLMIGILVVYMCGSDFERFHINNR